MPIFAVIIELHMIDNFLMENFHKSYSCFAISVCPIPQIPRHLLRPLRVRHGRQRQRQHQRRRQRSTRGSSRTANSGEEMEIDPSPADLKIFEPDFGVLKAEPSMSSIVNPSVGEDDDVAGNVIVKRKKKFEKLSHKFGRSGSLAKRLPQIMHLR
jgi:hypothetical protein